VNAESSSSSPASTLRPQRNAARAARSALRFEEPTYTDPESSDRDPSTEEVPLEDEDDNNDDGHSGGAQNGWDIAGIRAERILYDGRSYQQQYWVERVDPELTVKSGIGRFTEADAHDARDMTPAVLRTWRQDNPLVDVPWVYGGKKKRGWEKEQKKNLSDYQARWSEHCKDAEDVL
jgi:hypothetical protein